MAISVVLLGISGGVALCVCAIATAVLSGPVVLALPLVTLILFATGFVLMGGWSAIRARRVADTAKYLLASGLTTGAGAAVAEFMAVRFEWTTEARAAGALVLLSLVASVAVLAGAIAVSGARGKGATGE